MTSIMIDDRNHGYDDNADVELAEAVIFLKWLWSTIDIDNDRDNQGL